MFRVKYMFTRHPSSTLLWSTLLSWLCGTFTLHVFEFTFTPSFATWLVTSFDFLVGLGYGPLMPDTAVGRLCACYLTVVGVLSAAMITAMFAGSFELDPSELWLISQIERAHHSVCVKDIAARLLQHTFRVGLLVRREQALKQQDPKRKKSIFSRASFSAPPPLAVKKEDSFIRSGSAKLVEIRKRGDHGYRLLRISRLMRRLKRSKMNLAGAITMDSVSNIRVLHGEMNEVAKRLDVMQRRQDTVEAKLDSIIDFLMPHGRGEGRAVRKRAEENLNRAHGNDDVVPVEDTSDVAVENLVATA